ncbi:glycosyltransferase [uncultured Catenibacterium sp.]|uniref:glycosyltransferase n=1 Tax=uncultured Catenibacterium sp. TaxID=286142 RepID=UPI0025FAEC18|nr:glycosyltransferase [uncultured Catenibacterium sp.]
MRVLHLLQSSRFSGAENVVCQIINMIDNNYDIEMMYCSCDGQIREALNERNIKFLPIRNLTVKEVKRIIKEYKPDLIHAHDMRASFIGALACGNIPIISHIHNNNFDSRGVSLKSIAYLYAALKAKHIFWVSDSSYEGYNFHNLFKKKSEILYNIISIDKLYSKMTLDNNNYDYDIVYLGRITEQKNPLRLMKICKGIVDQLPSVKIAVIGTGDLEDVTHKEVERLELESNVTFLGFQSNPYKILHDSKLMIMTSLWEGTPMCVLEAMSLGVPVVSTPTDGVKIVVDNGKTGYLNETDEGLVNSCKTILTDTMLRENMSDASIKRAKELMDIEKYKKRIKNAYEKAYGGMHYEI